MIRKRAALIAVLSIGVVASAYAQETSPGPGTVEVTVIPGGATYFTSGDRGVSFGNYTMGGALTYNINRIVGVEGEVGGSFSALDKLQFGDLASSQKAPSTLTYSGNVVVSLPTHSSIVPYATGGVGGLTMFKQTSLGINNVDTFLTGNVGGGVKWYAPNSRWGLRGDYRFMATRSKDDAPAFFGQETRYGHRVYGAVIINAFR
jgi:outer membrane protein with beta-barrel domain